MHVQTLDTLEVWKLNPSGILFWVCLTHQLSQHPSIDMIAVKSWAEDSLKCTSFSFAGVLQPRHLIIITTSHQIPSFVGHLSCFFLFGGALWMDVPRLFIAIVCVWYIACSSSAKWESCANSLWLWTFLVRMGQNKLWSVVCSNVCFVDLPVATIAMGFFNVVDLPVATIVMGSFNVVLQCPPAFDTKGAK